MPTSLLTAANPHFINDPAAGGDTIPLAHHAAPPAAAADLAQLQRWLNGASEGLLDLYRAHDGLTLFARRDDAESGLHFLPVADMPAWKQDLASWLKQGDADYDEYTTCDGRPAIIGTPEWWDGAVVFAYFGYTPECLLMPTSGDYRGQIFIYEHDGGDDTSRIALNCADLFAQIRDDAPAFFRRYYGVDYYDVASYHAA